MKDPQSDPCGHPDFNQLLPERCCAGRGFCFLEYCMDLVKGIKHPVSEPCKVLIMCVKSLLAATLFLLTDQMLMKPSDEGSYIAFVTFGSGLPLLKFG